jgi:formylglycine-generating enzyme
MEVGWWPGFWSVTGLLACLAPFALSACALSETGPDLNQACMAELDVKTPGQASAAVVNSAPAPSATMNVPKPLSCKKGMLQVKGLYCTDLMHRCVKGGRTHTQEDTDEPEPYYCDGYLPGYAQCLEKEEPKHFCIDEFEYPNQAGAIPNVMVSWYEAKRTCEAQKKRLCGDDEWTLACEGPDRRPYPYGWARDRTACNIDHLWMQPNDGILGSHTASVSQIQAEVNRLSKRVASGSMPRCKSPYGVMDMTGNVDEWAVNVTLDRKPYNSAFKGGHWISGARNRCRGVTVSHDENTYYYSEGFRCCADPEPAAPSE